MYISTLATIVALIIYAAVLGVIGYLIYLVIRALRKYIGAQEVRKEAAAVRKSLSEILRENRIRCKMTQEFVAEALGVSRQAVSKWENGTADPQYVQFDCPGQALRNLRRGHSAQRSQLKGLPSVRETSIQCFAASGK